jgi:hypothetical protein
MTRLTDHHRTSIKRAIIRTIPVTDYITPLTAMVQDYLRAMMPAGIAEAYDNPVNRARYLSNDIVLFQIGNDVIDQREAGNDYYRRSYRPIWGWRTIMTDFEVENMTSEAQRVKFIFPDDLENADPVKANPYRREGDNLASVTGERDVLRLHKASMWDSLFSSGLVHAWVEDNRLYKQTVQRLHDNLAAASTIKRLYDVLEPELHQFIPVQPDKIRTTGLPSTVAPVVDDLRKLGVALAPVPTAESEAAAKADALSPAATTTNDEENQ